MQITTEGWDNLQYEMARDARRMLERELDELPERMEQLKVQVKLLSEMESVLKENSQLKEENRKIYH